MFKNEWILDLFFAETAVPHKAMEVTVPGDKFDSMLLL